MAQRRILAIEEVIGLVTWISWNRARLEIITMVYPYEKMLLRIVRRRLRRIPELWGIYRFRYFTVLGFLPEVFEIEPASTVPKMAFDYAKSISRIIEIPMEEVLRSRPVRQYIRRLREEVIL